LYDILDKKEEVFQKQHQAVKELIPNLKQKFTSSNKVPNVQVIEGLAAYMKVLDESLER